MISELPAVWRQVDEKVCKEKRKQERKKLNSVTVQRNL